MQDGSIDLMPGEKLLWSGQPGQGILLTAQDVVLIPFSLIWAGLTVFLMSSLVVGNIPLFIQISVLPIVMLCLYFVVGRFMVDAWMRTKIDYALTNRRVLISRGPPFPRVTSLALDKIPNISISEQAAGRGTIRFGPAGSVWSPRGFYGWAPSLDSTPQFISIENARAVFKQIQRVIPDSAPEFAYTAE